MHPPEFFAIIADGLRNGAWLTRRRVLEYTVLLFVFECIAIVFFAAGSHGLIVPLEHANPSDFISFYAAGSLAGDGTPALAYDMDAHYRAEQAVAGEGISYNYFYYPPVCLMLCALFAKLPYLPALYAFELLTLALYLTTARRIAGEHDRGVLLLLLAFPAVFWNFGMGQNAFLSASLFGAGMLLLDRRPVLAGIFLGALCYKPHFGLLVPIALAAGGHWRSFVSAGSTVLALIGASLVLHGLDTWQAFLQAAASSDSVYASDHIFVGGYASPFGLVLSLGGARPLAYAVQVAVSLAAALWVGIVFARRQSLPVRAATLLSATIVAIPIIQFYGLMLGVVAMIFLVRAGRANGFPPFAKTLLALLFVLPLVSGNLAFATPTLAAPLFAAGLFALTIAAARQEIARKPAIGKMAAAAV